MTELKIPDAKEALTLSEHQSIHSPANVLYEECKMDIFMAIRKGDKCVTCSRKMGRTNMQKLLDQGYGVFDRSNGDVEVHWFEDGKPSFMQLPYCVPSVSNKEVTKPK